MGAPKDYTLPSQPHAPGLVPKAPSHASKQNLPGAVPVRDLVYGLPKLFKDSRAPRAVAFRHQEFGESDDEDFSPEQAAADDDQGR